MLGFKFVIKGHEKHKALQWDVKKGVIQKNLKVKLLAKRNLNQPTQKRRQMCLSVEITTRFRLVVRLPKMECGWRQILTTRSKMQTCWSGVDTFGCIPYVIKWTKLEDTDCKKKKQPNFRLLSSIDPVHRSWGSLHLHRLIPTGYKTWVFQTVVKKRALKKYN